MPQEVRFNEDLGIIEIHSHGSITEAEILQSREMVMDLKAEKGAECVLVDTRQETTLPSTMVLFEFVVNLPANILVAFLVKKTQASRSDVRFAETVAVNRALPMRTFHSRDDAIEWLSASK